MGDEMRHTQPGNNNAYCQDSDLSWLDLNRAHIESHGIKVGRAECRADALLCAAPLRRLSGVQAR
jgi:isoamylase